MDENGDLWTVSGIILGALSNVITSYIGATLAGQEYGAGDLVVSAFSGAVAAGGLSCSIAAGVGEGIINGFVTLFETQSIEKAVADTVFGIAANSTSAAFSAGINNRANKGITYNVKQVDHSKYSRVSSKYSYSTYSSYRRRR